MANTYETTNHCLGIDCSHGPDSKPEMVFIPQLVGGLEHGLYDFPYIGNFIIPTDEVIFLRGVAQPPTSQSVGLKKKSLAKERPVILNPLDDQAHSVAVFLVSLLFFYLE